MYQRAMSASPTPMGSNANNPMLMPVSSAPIMMTPQLPPQILPMPLGSMMARMTNPGLAAQSMFPPTSMEPIASDHSQIRQSLSHPVVSSPASVPVSTGTRAKSNNDTFTLLQSGIHLPRAQPMEPTVSLNSGNNVGAAASSLLEDVVDLFPDTMSLDSLLSSSEMQVAWYNHLKTSRGTREGELFRVSAYNLI